MRLRENRARAWCTKHSVNSKAMGIARATAKELSKVFSRAKSWKYQSTLDQGAPTNDQLRRLLTAGFFLNAAVNKPTVQAFRRGGPQYFALYSGVLGSLFKGSSVPLLEKQQNVLPPWILFDSILRLNTTTFLVLATPLDDAWIQAESPAFYAMCCKKRAELPVQTIEFPHLPHPVVKGLFGKSYQHLQRWESQLKCTLTLDRDTGNLTVFCAPIHEAQIKSKLSSRIDLLLRRLGGQNAEFHYMGRTRAVVGEGFQVHELLFEDEFNSIVVRNLPDTTDGEIESQLVRWASRAGCGPDMIREVDLLRHLSSGSQSASVTIKFTTKTAARLMYDFVRGDASGGDVGESVTVTPVRVTADAEAAVGAEFAGRIKLTWADGEATGEAKVFFRTAHDANTFIRGIAASEWGATRAIAIGAPVDAPKTENVQPAIGRGGLNRGQRTPPKPGAQPPPPAARPPTRREPSGASDSFHVVFDVEAIDKLPLEDQVQFRYGVHLKPGLPRTMDEVELLTKVRRLGVSPVYAKVTRKPVAATTANDSVMARELEVRYSRMLPLLTCLDDTAVHTDFVDQGTRRVGVVVFCRDLPRLKETFEMAEASLLWSELEKPHGQPIRMEIEYSFTTTLHKDLRRCFREQLAQVLNFARAKGVETQEMQPKAVSTTAAKNMVTFKFLGEMAVLQRIKEKLDTVTHCEKVTLDNLHLVFSFTGRIKISRLMDKHIDEKNSTLRYFIRWINKRKEVWVYGDKPSREHAIGIVSTLIDELKTQSVLDKMVRLNLNKSLAPGAVNTWLATAPSVRGLYFHSVISSKRVIVTGSETKVEEFLQALTADNMLFQPRKRQCPEATTQVCPLCTCTVDDPSVVLTSCNDSYCVGCIEGMFKVSTLTLPALCWSGECRRRMHIDDLSKILPDAEAVASVVEMAVFDYVAKHKSEPHSVRCSSAPTQDATRFSASPRSKEEILRRLVGDRSSATCARPRTVWTAPRLRTDRFHATPSTHVNSSGRARHLRTSRATFDLSKTRSSTSRAPTATAYSWTSRAAPAFSAATPPVAISSAPIASTTAPPALAILTTTFAHAHRTRTTRRVAPKGISCRMRRSRECAIRFDSTRFKSISEPRS